MCTVNIQVDEALLRDVMPELDTPASIRLWAQRLIDLRIQEMHQKSVHNVSALDRDLTPEELYHVIEHEIDYIYENN